MFVKARNIEMTQGALLPAMLMFALPLMAASVLQLMFNAADIAVVGHFGSAHSLAAVGSTGSMINLFVSFIIGGSIGVSVLVSRALGARDFKMVRRIVHTSVSLGILFGTLCVVAGLTFSERLLILMRTPAEVLPLSVLYTRIYFTGTLPNVMYNFGAAILYANGDTKKPLFFLMVSGVFNVVMNLIFIICFKMDVAGVALATALSQALALTMILIHLTHRRDALRVYLNRLLIDRKITIDILKLGIPAGFQSVVFNVSNIVVQSAVNSLGALYMAAKAAVSNVDCFIWIAMNAFLPTATNFISRNIGAKKYGRINKITALALLCACVTGLILGGFAFFFGRELLGLYTSDPAVVDAGLIQLRLLAFTYISCGMMDTMTGALRGLGNSLLPAVISMTGACGLRLIWVATVFQIPEYRTFWYLSLAYPVSWTTTLFVLLVAYHFVRRRFPKRDGGEGR